MAQWREDAKKDTKKGKRSDSLHGERRAAGSFHRTLRLKYRINEDAIQAQLRDGVLTIVLPYREEVKPRQVEVAVA